MQLAGRQPSRMSVRRKVMKGTVKKIGTSGFDLFCPDGAGVFVRHDRAGCLAAGGDIWRVGLPRADASADCGGESCRSMEQHAQYKSSNNRDAEPDGERTTSRDRAGDCTGTGGVDRRERDDTPPVTLTPLTRTATQNACGPDGVNSICFDQADMAFTPGVLAFTRVISTDRLGVQVGSSAVSTQLGQILDADIYFNPSDSRTAFATPQALAAAPTAYDFESVLT